MHLNLEGRTALVGGSSRGIGRSIAEAFLKEGCRTVITGRDAASLHDCGQELRARFGKTQVLAITGDLLDSATVQDLRTQVLAQWGSLDILVVNLGSGRGKVGWDLAESDWKDLLAANLWGGVVLAQTFLPDMVAAQRGCLLFIASIAGLETLPAPLPYGAAKAALLHYAKALSRTLGPYHVRVNCIAPGNVIFPGGSWDFRVQADPDFVHRYLQMEVPLQRFGKPDEIGDLAAFLCSDRAAFITGACLVADGGQTRRI